MTTRRQFLRTTGLTAAAVTIGGAVLPLEGLFVPAAAQTAPKLDDQDYAAFAETVELAAASFYASVRSHLARPGAVAAATAAAQHHSAHAAAYGTHAGAKRVGTANRGLLQALTDQLSEAPNEDKATQIAMDLENALAATHLFLINAFTGKAGLQAAATMLPVESAHAVQLGAALGKAAKDLSAPDLSQSGFETQDKHLDPAAFPAVEPAATTTTVKK